MRKWGLFGLAALLVAPLLLSLTASAQDLYILDILTHPERYYNRTVTITGQVQAVQAAQTGTTRGQYTIFDDSTPKTLTVKSETLPTIGKIYKITGMIQADPAQENVPIMKEQSRSSTGSSSTTLIILVIAAVVFLVLLFLLFRIMSKSKGKASGAPVIRPAAGQAGPDLNKTIRVPPAAAGPAKTQVYLNLGASLVVEKGPDAEKEFPLHLLITTIGRAGARKNEVELNDETVSKEQASIHYDNTKKEFTLVNESKTNPTRVDQKEIGEPVVIAGGALIEMGRTVLRFKKG
jgi:hypothetical protein